MTTSATFASPATSLLKKDATVIGLVGLAHASSHFAHLLLPLMFPAFMSEFGLSYSQLGLLMSVFFVVSGLGQASAGFFVDRLGARPLLFAALGIFVLASGLASMVTGYLGLIGVAALAGLGNATFHPVDFTILNQRVSAPRLGHAFSAHGLTGNLGWAAAPVVLGSLTSLYNWRVAYLATAAMYGLIMLVLWVHRAHLSTQAVIVSRDGAPEPTMAFLKQPVVWWCFWFFLLSSITTAVVQSFLVSILKALHGVSFEVATVTLTAYMFCGALGMLVGGFLAARTPANDRVVASAMTVAAVLLGLCATRLLGASGTLLVLAGTGFAVGIAGPSRDMMIKKAAPQGATGRVYGLVYSGLDIGFAVSPLIFGAFMDRGWYRATLLGAAVALVLSVGAALQVRHRRAPGPALA